MADEKRVDYEEILLEAMSILSKKQIESISFDKTIEAVVTDASKASDGVYTVSTGSSEFLAYSTETEYKVNDAVMVTVPQGNFDKQKIIIGKQVDKMNTPMIYKSPFQKLVDVSNNLIDDEHEISFWANRTTGIEGKCWDKEELDFKNSSAYTELEDGQPVGLIWSSGEIGDIFEEGFTCIGLSAQFSTWLSEYNTIAGNYGLVLEITFKCMDIETNDPAKNTFVKYVTFDSDEFFGDVYNFETYYTQEQLFNIEEFKDFPIVRLRLFAYQRNNFVTFNNVAIYTNEEFSSSFTGGFDVIQPNIFIKDPYVCLGIPIEDFETDTATILTNSSQSYSKGSAADITAAAELERMQENTKTLGLRWVHKDSLSGIVKAVQPNEIPAGYEIYWYRFQLGAPSPDQFAGAHWARFRGCRISSAVGGVITYSADSDGDYCYTEAEYEQDNSIDIVTDRLDSIVFIPNVNNQTEQLKAIVVKNEGTDEDPIWRRIAASNVVTFTNSTDVRSKATFIDENALSIAFDDDERGNYFLYNRAGNVGKEEDKEIRKLIAVFDPQNHNVYEKAELQPPYTSIKWIFPLDNTMIIPSSSIDKDTATQVNTQNPDSAIFDTRNNTITYSSDSDGIFRTQVGFFIKPTLNRNATNNTVRLEVQKDGQEYTAQVQMLFGTAGTSGSDYTLFIVWEDGKNALNLSDDISGTFDHTLSGQVYLMDQAGELIEIPPTSTWTPSWKIASEATSECSRETENIYRPAFLTGGGSNRLSPLTNDKLTAYASALNIDSEDMPTNEAYYYISESTRSGDYYTFDPTKTNNKWSPFVSTPDELQPSATRIVYKKASKDKLEFKEITLQEEDWDASHRFFVKIDNYYVLDPWSSYQEIETYYVPVKKRPTQYQSNTLRLTKDATISNRLTIDYVNKPNINSLFVLQITLTNFGDHELSAYFPVPLKNGETFETTVDNGQPQKTFVIDYIEGPTDVRYATDGETDFNKNPYQITARQFNTITNKFDVYRHGYQTNDHELNGYWRLVFPSNVSEETVNFLPSLKETGTTLAEGNYDIPTLQPVGIYFEDALPYGVQFVTTRNNTDVVLWTQPVFVYKDNYPSTTLNQWNGKDILTDNNEGTIVANGFAAGKKERDNTFTGVVLGDWSRTDTDKAITKNTGVYGFNHGAMSYALKDDGTAFFGKDGNGRIYFNGNKAQIYSSRWANTDNPRGMLLDIDDGVLDIRGNNGANVYISPKSDRYFEIKDEGGNSLLKVSSNNYYLQTSNFSEDRKTGVQLNLESGRFTGYNFAIQANNSSNNENKYIKMDSTDNNYPLQIGIGDSPNFKVEWNGSLYSNSGRIGGWNIVDNSLNNSDENNANTTTVKLYAGANRDFGIWAIRGTIGDWGIYDDKIFAPSTLDAGLIALINNSESSYKMQLLKPQLWYNTMLDSTYGILTNQLTFYISLRKQFEILPNSILSSSTVPVPIMLGSGGLIIGDDGNMNTWGLGFRSSNNRPIMIEATNSNIRLSGAQGDLANSIFLHSETIEIGKSSSINSSGTNDIILSIQDKKIRIYKDISDNNKIKIYTDIDATNQTGIYARFAP